jgi:hypothetical protein
MERRVVFVTGDAVHTPAARALSIAGVPVLVKPVDLEAIARAVAEVVRTAELEGEERGDVADRDRRAHDAHERGSRHPDRPPTS